VPGLYTKTIIGIQIHARAELHFQGAAPSRPCNYSPIQLLGRWDDKLASEMLRQRTLKTRNLQTEGCCFY